jgi:hypothetical protein
LPEQIKLYLASLLGISERPDPAGSEKHRYIHVPLFIDAQSMETAEEEACIEANRLFPKGEGFHLRHIAIRPITEAEYLRLLQFSQLGLLTNDEPPEQGAEFLCSEAGVDPEESVIFEFGKPAN